MMAREFDLATPLGAVLNELGDVLSDLALYLPLAFVHPPSRWPALAFVLGALLTEFCGVLSQALGRGRQYQGPMGKSDRAFWIGALTLTTGIRADLFSIWPVFFVVASALTVITCGLRLRAAATRTTT
jgi:phosphatidylglycerophosphate synthase